VSALFVDLYEVTMAASYHANGLDHAATFDLFVRALPPERNFLVACGLDEVLRWLEDLRFTADDLAYLDGTGLFAADFLERLAALRFTGDVWAVPEGEVVFAGEPLLELRAPLIEAQLAETFVINAIASQTMVASKAARVAIACGGRPFVDFSARRDHGVDAALRAARAAVVGGASGTSLVEAGRRFGIPLSGTMAHSYVMSFASERKAFLAYARDFPDGAILLVDTYDTVAGARTAADVAVELAREGIRVRGVRLDSGDLGVLARDVRSILDDAGLRDVQILASGDLDEHRIETLLGDGAPIDAFGVGTRLGVSEDAPSLGMVYKLVADETGPKVKLSRAKVTLPGAKQVWRCDGFDVLSLADETVGGGRPLLEPVMAGGRRLAPPPPLDEAAARRREAVSALPGELRSLGPAAAGAAWRVETSPRLGQLVAELAGAPR
jgi:nicotinate phosphoribosyltransferase